MHTSLYFIISHHFPGFLPLYLYYLLYYVIDIKIEACNPERALNAVGD